jgi:hypothetical protein
MFELLIVLIIWNVLLTASLVGTIFRQRAMEETLHLFAIGLVDHKLNPEQKRTE